VTAPTAQPSQLDLSLEDESRLDRRFREWVEANPAIVAEIIRLALVWVERRPGQRLGMKMLFETSRWHLRLAAVDPNTDYALDNSMTSRLARLVMEREPRLAGLFELRELKSSRLRKWAKPTPPQPANDSPDTPNP
jgi:hypothetical protein